MTSWLSLADLVRVAHRHRVPIDDGTDLRMAAGAVIAKAWPHLATEDELGNVASLVNVCVLALRMERLIVHELVGDVPETVASTDLHTLPTEPPRLLQQPCIIQVRDAARWGLLPGSLGEHTAALGCYELDGTYYLIGIDWPDGAIVSRWRPQWGTRGDGDIVEEPAALVSDVEGHAEWGRTAARFLVVLGLLLDATSTPLRTSEHGPQIARRRRGKSQVATPWATRRVYLEGVARAASEADSEESGDATLRDGMVPEEVEVRGHLKRQPYGEGRKLRRWVYVQGYAARRWTAVRPLRVIVSKTPRR